MGNDDVLGIGCSMEGAVTFSGMLGHTVHVLLFTGN